MTGTALQTNEILQHSIRGMQILVLNKIIVAFTAKKILLKLSCHHINRRHICFNIKEQNRSTERCSKLKRSVDMTSSGKNDLNIRTNASPKWDRTRCPEE